MEFSKLIEERRSIRAYAEGTVITRDEIEQMVYAAQQAPSWKNSQTGRYYVAFESETVKALRETCLASFNYDRTLGAAAFVLATFKKGISGFKPDGTPADELGNGWGAFDLGLQNAYFLLKARELGYDTLIMGLRDEAKLRELFDVSDDEIAVGLIALGKRAADPDKPERKALDEIVKFF